MLTCTFHHLYFCTVILQGAMVCEMHAACSICCEVDMWLLSMRCRTTFGRRQFRVTWYSWRIFQRTQIRRYKASRTDSVLTRCEIMLYFLRPDLFFVNCIFNEKNNKSFETNLFPRICWKIQVKNGHKYCGPLVQVVSVYDIQRSTISIVHERSQSWSLIAAIEFDNIAFFYKIYYSMPNVSDRTTVLDCIDATVL